VTHKIGICFKLSGCHSQRVLSQPHAFLPRIIGIARHVNLMWSVGISSWSDIQSLKSDQSAHLNEATMFPNRAAWISSKNFLLIRIGGMSALPLHRYGFCQVLILKGCCLISKMHLRKRCWPASIQWKNSCSLGNSASPSQQFILGVAWSQFE